MNERYFQDKDRVFTRTQGCWNCKHYASANAFWTKRRQDDLQEALRISISSPAGENDPKASNIKKMVNRVDHLVARREVGLCTNPSRPVDAHNNEIATDLFQHSFLCSKWDAASGASLAREGAKADILPEELVDKVDGHKPTDLSQFVSASLLGRRKVT